MLFETVRKLKALGVLGINRRNAAYTFRFNQRQLYPLVDDKLLTKELAKKAGMMVPEIYAIFHTVREIQHLPQLLEKHGDFVVKPARGSGGEGILVIAGRMKDMYRTVTGELLSESELTYHVQNIQSGIAKNSRVHHNVGRTKLSIRRTPRSERQGSFLLDHHIIKLDQISTILAGIEPHRCPRMLVHEPGDHVRDIKAPKKFAPLGLDVIPEKTYTFIEAQ